MPVIAPPATRVFVALDVPAAADALALGERLGLLSGDPADPRPGVKVGLELFTGAGPPILEDLAGRGLRVFCDLKLHDIPTTVERAAAALGERGVWMLSAHASGGRAMLEAAVAGARAGAARKGLPAPRVLAVTVLTSLDAGALRDAIGLTEDVQAATVRLARLARAAGCDGVVCSPREAAAVKAACGPGFLVVTPGTRPAWAGADDQRRTGTPAEAIAAGADYLVVGRPVTAALDPRAALERLIAEVAAAP